MMRLILDALGVTTQPEPPAYVQAFDDTKAKLKAQLEREDPIGEMVEGLRSTTLNGAKRKRKARPR